MRVLLVDDSLTIRSLLRRTLVELIQPEICEASNGIEALAHIVRQRFDLVVLDVNMPVMDGVETLEAVRTSPAYALLPVVVLSSERNEATVRRLVELGVSDFLSKPLRQEQLAERLSQIVQKLQERARPPVPLPGHSGRQHHLLVAEQDPDRRHYFVTVLGPHYQVIEADSAAAALQTCLVAGTPSLDVVLLGEQIGLPPVQMAVPKLRTLAPSASARLIGCQSPRRPADPRTLGFFDGMLDFSPIPEVFLAQLQRVLAGADTPLAKILVMRPSLRKDVVSATEQVFGIMLSTPVELRATVLPRDRFHAADAAHATIGLQTECGLVLELRFDASIEATRAIAARMIAVEVSDVQGADVLASAAEFVNIVMGRLRNRLVENGIHAQVQLPKTWIGDAPQETVEDPEAPVLQFESPACGIAFQLTMSAMPIP